MNTHDTNGNAGVGEAARPYWVPSGIAFDELPEELRTAIIAVVNPGYQQLVLAARDGLEKATGMTIVHLLWLEILDQIQLGRELTDPQSALSASEEREKLIARHLRLVGAKTKASGFLLRLHQFRRKWGIAPDPLGPRAHTSPLPGEGLATMEGG